MAENEEWQEEFLEKLTALTEETLQKSVGEKGDKPVRNEPISFFVNPYDYTASTAGMWRERRSSITWDTLRTIAEKNPVISAIINTRIQQVSAFSSPVRLQDAVGNDNLGYKIVHRDKNKKLTKTEEKYIIELEDFIWHSGLPDTYNIYDRDHFDTWLRKTIRDTLTFDAAVTELIPTRRGNIAEYHAVDAATIRMAVAKQDIDAPDEKAFVQVLNGQIVAEFEAKEIMYGIRNPTTNIRNNGYGVSEIEQLIGTVTNIFNAMAHNAMFFRNGAAVKGLINIKPNSKGSGAPHNQLEAFKRAWHTMVNGTANAWKTPILQADGVEFVNMGNTNKEMEFQKYLDFLVKLTCAIYAIDPAEINFYMQASGANGGSAMFEGSQAAKLKMSKDKGLRPLLSAISRWINQFIITKIAPEYYFSFVGIDSKDEKEIIDLRKTEVSAYKKIDEVRAEAGLDPLGKEGGGDLILNPQYLQWLQQQAMEKMQAAGGGEGGEGDQPGEGGQEPGDQPDEEDQPDEQGKEGGKEDEPDLSAHLEAQRRGEEDGEDETDSPIKKSLAMGPAKRFLRITLDD